MRNLRNFIRARRSGMSSVLALVLMATFAALGAAYAAANTAQVIQSGNHAHVQQARLMAESGLSFHSRVLSRLSLPAAASGQALMDALASAVGTRLNGTANLAGQSVNYNGSTIVIPAITDGAGRSFSATIALDGDQAVLLRVTGLDGAISRQVAMRFALAEGSSGVFDFAIASRSKISATGNAAVRGANSRDEANVLTATYSDLEAVKLTGNCEIEGDVSISNPDAHATLTGNISVGGESNWGEDILDHIHIGVGDVTFPEVNPAVFEPFATTLVTASTGTSGNKTFTNIRIVANANKTFSGNITLKGVVFVEAPNTVHFSGNVTLTGVIVTQDAGENVYEANTIKFTGNTTVRGVEQLPDTAEFHDLRALTGSFLLAPGFGVEFTGNFGTVSGTMAADKFKFTGNAGGTVYGSIINYSDSEFKLTGNSALTFDRSSTPATPAGFSIPGQLLPVATTYTEY